MQGRAMKEENGRKWTRGSGLPKQGGEEVRRIYKSVKESKKTLFKSVVARQRISQRQPLQPTKGTMRGPVRHIEDKDGNGNGYHESPQYRYGHTINNVFGAVESQTNVAHG